MKLGILINTINWSNLVRCAFFLLCCIHVVPQCTADDRNTSTATLTTYISSIPTEPSTSAALTTTTDVTLSTQDEPSPKITTTQIPSTPQTSTTTQSSTSVSTQPPPTPTTTAAATTTTTTAATTLRKTVLVTTTEASTTTQLATTTTTTTTEVAESERCHALIDLKPKNNDFIVNVTKGDIVITIISTKYTSAPFIAERINELKLIKENVTLGLRHIWVMNTSVVQEVLEKEARYLKECEEYPIGIFIHQNLWHLVKSMARDLGFNVWSVPSLERLRFTSMAKLFYELPWSRKKASVEVLTENEALKDEFLAAARTEKMCFEQRPNATTLQIVLGDDITPEENVTTVIVNFSPHHDFSTMPNVFLISEAHLDLRPGLNGTRNASSYEVHPTDFMVHGALLLELTQWLNDSINSNCLRRSAHLGLGGCSTILQDTPQISFVYLTALHDLVRNLELEPLLNTFKFELIDLRNSPPKPIASLSLTNNVTTIYRQLPKYRNGTAMNSKLGQFLSCTAPNTTRVEDLNPIRNYEKEFYKNFWRIRPDSWVAAGLTLATIGIVVCLVILAFLFSRICIQDVLEGNPTGSILLLFALVLQFASFIPFSIEYTGYHQNMPNMTDTLEKWNAHCSVKIFLVSLCYCLTFSLLLCRAVMLASIGSEGGFLSHVNGYLQSIICFFSTLVQIGLSTQLLVIMNTSNQPSCNDIYYGHWFWSVVAYDGFLLALLVLLGPLIIKSQRNYREGILIVFGSGLALICWIVWVPLCLLGDDWREVAIPLGSQATGLAILGGILVPRFILILKSIARADLVQALPSLTSLAFAQAANQYASEQKYFQNMYDCVNPNLRASHMTGQTEHTLVDSDFEDVGNPSPSQVPTLPLRTNRNFGNINHYYRQHNGHTNNIDFNNEDSLQLNLPPPATPDKMTRF